MDPQGAALDHIESLLGARQAAAAELAAVEFTLRHSERVEGHVLLGRALQQQGKFAAALRAVAAATRRVSRHPAAMLLYVECLLQTGERERALLELKQLEHDAQAHPRLLQDVGQIYSHLNLHIDAERCFASASAQRPGDSRALYNWATCLIALGQLEEAERALTKVIELAPNDHDAYYNRSTLRRQSADRNHVPELQAAVARAPRDSRAYVSLGYALAKELEDLNRYAESFAALKRAADARRRQLSYRVSDDTQAMAEIAQQFDAAYCSAAAAAPRSSVGPRLIFVVGLPRSGTTLIDRILSSHSLVLSRGESTDLASSVMQAAGPVADKGALIRRTALIDPAPIGEQYRARLPKESSRFLIDKTPLNFLYLGLIARSLPEACIIHVRRHPYDVCYAMYKTLFRMAYPCSYDLEDLAEYYTGYARLMQHWRSVLGGRLIEVAYEDLIAEQEVVSRRLLTECGLPWEEACLEFHKNASPSLTASAAQVRLPLYTSSVGLWQRYQLELQPLIEALRARGTTSGT